MDVSVSSVDEVKSDEDTKLLLSNDDDEELSMKNMPDSDDVVLDRGICSLVDDASLSDDAGVDMPSEDVSPIVFPIDTSSEDV